MSEEREIETGYELPDFIAELRRLADALESGAQFELEIGGETISVPARAVVAVEYEEEDGNAELEFQLSWELEADDDEGAAEDEAEEEDA